MQGPPPPRPSRLRSRLTKLALAAVATILAIFLCEGLLRLAFRYPSFIARVPTLLRAYRDYYMAYERNIPHWDPKCARYDPALFYLLKPGRCTFANREFNTQLSINQLGVRDDEASLEQPEIVVIGDSLAMGWGVEEETFAQILERSTGLRVLNAAVSSYGTVREMTLLSRIDRSKLRYLIIQYCNNDHAENLRLAELDNVWAPLPEAEYRARVERYMNRPAPWMAWSLTKGMVSGLFDEEPQATSTDREEAQLFLNALLHASAVDLDGVEVIVFELAGWARNDPLFVEELTARIANEQLPAYIESARILDLSKRVTSRHYHVFDDHLNPKGHQAIAAALLETITERAAREGN